MFISEIAAREPRPRRTVLRGSKALAQSGWDGQNYRLVHHTTAEVVAFLEKARVDVVVLDRSGAARGEGHLEQMSATVHGHPGRFTSLGRFPILRGGHRIDGAIEVWGFGPATHALEPPG